MSINNSPNIPHIATTERTTLEIMEHYDTLPLEVRRVLQNSPYNLNIKEGAKDTTPESLDRFIRNLVPREVTRVYGSSHPQAQ